MKYLRANCIEDNRGKYELTVLMLSVGRSWALHKFQVPPESVVSFGPGLLALESNFPASHCGRTYSSVELCANWGGCEFQSKTTKGARKLRR